MNATDTNLDNSRPTDERRDSLFATNEAPTAGSFEFGRSVVRVFDDMVSRSVPLYETIQLLTALIVLRCRASGPICDLGCSTGTTLAALINQTHDPLDLIGVDKSADMLDACRDKLAPILRGHRLTLHRADLEEMPDSIGRDWGAVVLSLVAQFLRPMSRQKLLAEAARRLRPGGCLVMIEKTVQRSTRTTISTLIVITTTRALKATVEPKSRANATL